jgi:hypothetical protein
MHRLTIDRTQQLLEAARTVRVLVVGDVMLDVYLRGAASRISPEAPVPVVRVEEEWRALGGAANVAANVVALGAGCELVGCIGDDAPGDGLTRELERLGIGHGTGPDAGPAHHDEDARAGATPAGRPLRPRDGGRAASGDQAARVVEAVRTGSADGGRAGARGLQQGPADAPGDPRRGRGRAAGRPAGGGGPEAAHFFDYHGATVFKPNQAELAAALRTPVEAHDAAWLEDVRRQLGCEHLLVTLGEDGMALLTADGEHLRVPTVARSVYDVSGAGDTVTAVLAVAWPPARRCRRRRSWRTMRPVSRSARRALPRWRPTSCWPRWRSSRASRRDHGGSGREHGEPEQSADGRPRRPPSAPTARASLRAAGLHGGPDPAGPRDHGAGGRR